MADDLNKQNPVTIAQFAATVSLGLLFKEIAVSDGKIDARRLMKALKAVQNDSFANIYPESAQLINAFATDMENALGK